MRRYHLVLIKKRELAVMLQHALYYKHHIGAPGIVFVKDDCRGIPQGPRQDALLEFGHLLPFAQLYGVLADQVDAADMAVEIDANAWPVQPGCNLLDMSRFARAVIALDNQAPIAAECGENRQRRVGVELVGGVQFRHALRRLGKSLDSHIAVDAECLSDRYFLSGLALIQCSVRHVRPRNEGISRRPASPVMPLA